jgi:hypothetical protein
MIVTIKTNISHVTPESLEYMRPAFCTEANCFDPSEGRAVLCCGR